MLINYSSQEWEFCVLRRLLDSLPVSVEGIQEPVWEVFHTAQLRAAIAACELGTARGGRRVSVPRLHAVLARELAALHATAPQRALVAQEIQKVCIY